MAQQVAYLEAVVGADITNFRRAMSDVRSSLLDIGGLSQTLRTVGRDLTFAVTTPLLAAAGGALGIAAQFDAAMRNIASISDAVAHDFGNSSAVVLEWGSSLREGPIAAAEALNTVMQAGFGINDFNEALLVAQISATTAEAGLADLTTTTEALVAALLSYSAGADQAQYYSDILTRMVQVGVGTMGEFGNSLAQVLPSAATLGVQFDELGGLMAYLTQRGFPASRAATSLGNAFNKLITPSEDMNRVWRELGVTSGSQLIETFGGVQGAFNALFEIADDSPDAARALAAMFPDERGRRAIQLAMADVDAFNATMNEFMEDITGATARAHSEQMKSFSAQFDLLRSALQELGITIGQEIIPVVLPVVQELAGAINDLSETNPDVFRFALAVGALAASIGPLAMVLGIIITPLGAVIAAFGALTALLATDFNGWGSKIHDELLKIFPSLPQLENTIDQMLRIFSVDTERITEDYHGGKLTHDVPIGFFERMRRAIEAGAPTLGLAFSNMIDDGIDWLFNTGIPSLDDLTSGLLNQLSVHFSGSWYGNYKGANSPVYDGFRSLLDGGIGDAIDDVGSWLQEHFPKLTASVDQFIKNFTNWVEEEGAPTLGALVGYAFGKASTLIIDAIKGIFTGVDGTENPIVREFRQGIETGWADAMADANIEQGTISGDLGNKIVLAIAGAIAVASFVPVTSALGVSLIKAVGAWAIGSGGLAIVNALASGILGGAVTFTSWSSVASALLANLAFGIKTYLLTGWTILSGAASAIISAIGTAIAAVVTSTIGMTIIVALVGALAGIGIYQALVDVLGEDWARQAAQDILNFIASGFGVSNFDYGLFEDQMMLVIGDPIARVLDALGIQHGLWDVLGETQRDISNQMSNGESLTFRWEVPELNTEAYEGSLEELVRVTDTQIGAVQEDLQWFSQALLPSVMRDAGRSVEDGADAYSLPLPKIHQKTVETTENTISALTVWKNNLTPVFDLIVFIVSSNSKKVQEWMDYLVAAFDVKEVSLSTEPFTTALLNLWNSISPLISKIVEEWNKMLALVGQQVIINTPQTPTINPPANPATTSGGAKPGGIQGGGGGGKPLLGVKLNAPEINLSNTQPANYSRGDVTYQSNTVTVVSNDPDDILNKLRARGIDLRAGKRA